ncbi:Cytochrome oxidase assembly [Claviceps purpurea]|nr:Cytochrome oxidase assembly [Claviceps purpurea]KAG6160687.1 Cytochrome oxidase assembly [Claviceps purpurea]KAG6160986.1 Cytochrome oxidase assembly [Claviceps purpurea]KAG6184891.1 Cytochrome oxidase assembly [Claviceps purpurea]KAG6188912.1 Cytochrome oxidase assembly [Claviceps purpurea]
MPTFQNKKFRSAANTGNIASQYRRLLNKNPFLFFGLPFLTVIVGASFVLTPATAIRYERHDRKVRRLTRQEELGLKRDARPVDMREEYYRLQGRELEDWDQKRVKRLPGEPDGIL